MTDQIDISHYSQNHAHSSKSEGSSSQAASKSISSTIFQLFFIIIFSNVFLWWIYFSMTLPIPSVPSPPQYTRFLSNEAKKPLTLEIVDYQFKCSNDSVVRNCPTNDPLKPVAYALSTSSCPEYFRWVHEDLRPWKSTGISRAMVEKSKKAADFRLVIVKGTVYLKKYGPVYETRDLFTIWGILQLLRLYPGKVPDLDLMFSCGDRPRIKKSDYQGPNATLRPIMFQYCADQGALGVVLPDWSFWGWAETNIQPWTSVIQSITQGNKRSKWKDRIPYAYWRGNPYVNRIRPKLMKCNVSNKHDWNARLYKQNWTKESKQGHKNSKLEDQCIHRYKIYIEGWGWSVSEKYILACDSMVLFVKPQFYDFFTRSLVPMKHYWHIRREDQCRDIKFAVEWGNNHTNKAEAIGKEGSRFIQENLKMEYVYDYMFHVLSEYAKLLKFKPTIPEGATEVCSEVMECSQEGLWKKFMVDSMVKSPSKKLPCAMPPPYASSKLEAIIQKKERIYKAVEALGDKYWERLNKTH